MNIPDNELWNRRKKNLEKLFAKAALDLMEHTAAAAMVLPVAHTTPPLFICIGTADQVCGMLLNQKQAATATKEALNNMRKQPK